MDKSALFTAFNVARTLAHDDTIDAARLNRALGVAQRASESHIERYHSTPLDCECPDRVFRGGRCKGMLACALLEVS